MASEDTRRKMEIRLSAPRLLHRNIKASRMPHKTLKLKYKNGEKTAPSALPTHPDARLGHSSFDHQLHDIFAKTAPLGVTDAIWRTMNLRHGDNGDSQDAKDPYSRSALSAGPVRVGARPASCLSSHIPNPP
ncbi:hypothetical protein [Pseudooceanicola antarcticus]|uniref:hypothetical protein n=1 Tax=Pseudooceanicola antarcticus TaxID=1247613 RepID=UPI00117B6028|nr:hypothetical protein [Pseudooceanicola antarcticus]